MSTLDKYSTINNNLGTISNNSFSSITKEKNNLSKHYDDLFKLVIIGDSGVGKSCILLRFADDTFTDNYYSTIGVDFRFKCVDIGERKCKLQIWDTAGQERFKTVTSAYYRGADGILIVYDQTDKNSFDHLNDWLDDILKYTTDEPIKLIIGNKDDLNEQKVISDDDIRNFVNKTNIEIVKTSAKSAFQVNYAFEKLTQKLINSREGKKVKSGYNLEQTPLEGKFAQNNICSCGN